MELIKGCGVIPYLFQKNHSYSVNIVGASEEEYSYLETYINSLNM